ncbi:MAG: hypothetical protein IIC70_10000 [Acidobacteria bacterium]|nr:hypothetical protein [Acidobacteriota bacterium]
MLNFHWRYTKNWSFQGTYWNTDSEAEHFLTNEFEFDGEVFAAGLFVNSGIDTSITRLFWGRSFFRRPSTDWGVGLGLHVLDIDIFLAGEVQILPPGSTEFRRETASASAPLPNLGIWYMYSWSPKWVVTTRLDWLDLTIEEFSGSMYDLSVGVDGRAPSFVDAGLTRFEPTDQQLADFGIPRATSSWPNIMALVLAGSLVGAVAGVGIVRTGGHSHTA